MSDTVCRPGYRHANYGTLYNVGNNGYSWSSSVPAGTNAYYLNFNNTVLNPQNTTNRANGLQVRCLQAFVRGRSVFFCTAIRGRMRFESMLQPLFRLHVE